MTALYATARECLDEADPARKVALTLAAAEAFARGELQRNDDEAAPLPIGDPGRPAKPVLVHPRDLPQRGLGSREGRAAFVHAIAHIEFNAINLAWDAVYRFRAMPDAYYADWVGVAADEARHFTMLRGRLRYLGADYGDFEAHNGLWDMAQKTADDVLARMALVPRVLEARGLDVTPGMITRLRGLGDGATADILEVILSEEVAHVAAGSRWFHWGCERAGVSPGATFFKLVREHARGAVRGPFNLSARRAAGFGEDELQTLSEWSA